MGRILRTFLAGVLALLPIAVTVFVVAWIASFIASYAGPDSFVGRLIIRLGASVGIDVTPGSIAAYLLGLAMILAAIFVLGLFWKRANEAGALAAALGSFLLSIALKLAWPELPFVNRVGLVFVLAAALAVLVSLATPSGAGVDRIRHDGVSYATAPSFNLAAIAVLAILVALYAVFW